MLGHGKRNMKSWKGEKRNVWAREENKEEEEKVKGGGRNMGGERRGITWPEENKREEEKVKAGRRNK